MEIVIILLIVNFLLVLFLLIRKCYIIGFFVFFFIGERYGDLVGELFWKLLEEVFFFIWVGRGFVFRGVKLFYCFI